MITQYTNESSYMNFSDKDNQKKRGLMVYSPTQLQQITGRDKEGKLMSWGWEQPYFYLSLKQRLDMFRLSSPIFGVVASRMNRLSGLEFNVSFEKKEEDQIVNSLKDYESVYKELKESLDLSDLTLKAKMVQLIKETLPDIKLDLSNFESALLRWKRRLKNFNASKIEEVMAWLIEPNNGLSWEEFVKKFVFDMLIHGSIAIYKDVENNKLENFDLLPGGSVYKIKAPYFSSVSGYVQVIPGLSEPQVYFHDEIAYMDYAPTSSRNYGMVPLEALINKVAESLMFDSLMANQADGTKPPEKIIIVTDNNPFGSMDSTEKTDIPLDEAEQKRIEEKVNQPVKGSIMTFSGSSAQILDLSRENTMGVQMQRQKDIREEVALVFSTTNMEMNLSDGAHTSGRSTSEAQEEIEQGRGIAPLAKSLENIIQRSILPYRYGSGFIFTFEKAQNNKEEKELDLLSLQTGEMTKNEIREKYNKYPFGPEYDNPDNTSGVGNEEQGISSMFDSNYNE